MIRPHHVFTAMAVLFAIWAISMISTATDPAISGTAACVALTFAVFGLAGAIANYYPEATGQIRREIGQTP